MVKVYKLIIIFFVCFFVFSCATRFRNQKIETYDHQVHGRTGIKHSEFNSPELSLILAFSGGGTRAAALSYGVLESFNEISLPTEDEPATHTLLNEIDYISSVSGGSFTAAYYSLYGHDIFSEFPEKFLYRNIGGSLFLNILAPWNWIRLASINYGRTDLAAEYYDKKIFTGATYQNLTDHGVSGLAIQATDLVSGERFSFTPSYFSRICSDLKAFPISRAVAASSAFPGPFGAVTLKNYANSCDFNEEAWIEEELIKRETTERRFHLAKALRTYTEPGKKRYIHLVDGGVSDNLGIRGPLEATAIRGGFIKSLQKKGRMETRKVAIVIVNAQTTTPKQWALADIAPNFTQLLDAVSTTMINRYNFETVTLLKKSLKEWAREAKESKLLDKEGNISGVDFYVIEVGFDAIKDDDERLYFSGIATSLGLSDEKVDDLRQVAKKILWQSADFKRLVKDLGGQAPGQELQKLIESIELTEPMKDLVHK